MEPCYIEILADISAETGNANLDILAESKIGELMGLIKGLDRWTKVPFMPNNILWQYSHIRIEEYSEFPIIELVKDPDNFATTFRVMIVVNYTTCIWISLEKGQEG